MKYLLLIFAFAVVAKGCLPTYKPGPQQCACGVPLSKRRIVGGTPALVDEYPWMVALTDPETGAQFCAGSLLSSTTVLTAAHCMPPGQKPIAVALPNGDVTFENATKILTSKIEIHPYYLGSGITPAPDFDNDYAILTLATPVAFSESIMPICLPDPNKEYADVVATATGWGLTTPPTLGSQPSPILLAVNITTMSNEKCKASLPLTSFPPPWIPGAITPNMICAFQPGAGTVCNGDSGGPFIALSEDGAYYSQIGVTSWGVYCESISVYSRVTQQMYWIMRHMTGDTCAPPSGTQQ